jgi:hypothetical protein
MLWMMTVINNLKTTALIGLIAALTGCGGDSSGDSNSGSNNQSDSSSSANMSVAPTNADVSLIAEGGEFALEYVYAPLINYQGEVFYYWAETLTSTAAESVVERVRLGVDGNEAQIEISLKPHGNMQPNVYEEEIAVYLCVDSFCNQEIPGSPISVAIDYEVPERSVRATSDSITVSEYELSDSAPVADINLELHNLDFSNVFVTIGELQNGITRAIKRDSGERIELTLEKPNALPVGLLESQYSVTVCYDDECNYEVLGSPVSVELSYEVVGPDPFSIASEVALTHNIIDAGYSPEFNSVVIAATLPSNKVIIYDLDDLSSVDIDLTYPPTSVAVDKLNGDIAVGHDARASLIVPNQSDLSLSEVTDVSIAMEVYDVVINNKKVLLTPKEDQWTQMWSIDMNDDYLVSQSTGHSIYEQTIIKLAPGGDSVYTLDTRLSPADIEKFSITSVAPEYQYDSIYHGEYGMCGNMWVFDNGPIFNACGITFTTTDNEDTDLRYNGKLAMTSFDSCRITILDLAQAKLIDESLYIESLDDFCSSDRDNPKQWLRLASVETLQEKEVYNFPTKGDQRIIGDFVFYDESDFPFLIYHDINTTQYYLAELTTE